MTFLRITMKLSAEKLTWKSTIKVASNILQKFCKFLRKNREEKSFRKVVQKGVDAVNHQRREFSCTISSESKGLNVDQRRFNQILHSNFSPPPLSSFFCQIYSYSFTPYMHSFFPFRLLYSPGQCITISHHNNLWQRHKQEGKKTEHNV